MKIFVEIPEFPNNEFKAAAVRAICNLSNPSLTLKEAKDMVETPGWHHIPNNMVEPLGKTKHDLISFVERQRIDYDSNSDALYNYGAQVVFYMNNGQPAGYKPPTPTPEPLPPTPNDLLDSLTPALTKALEIRDYTMLRIVAGVAEDIIEKYNL